jgi:hypothetical protein
VPGSVSTLADGRNASGRWFSADAAMALTITLSAAATSSGNARALSHEKCSAA